MKLRIQSLALLVLALGGLGAGGIWYLQYIGYDQKGLLRLPYTGAFLCACAVVMLFVLWATRMQPEEGCATAASVWGAAGALIPALGLLISFPAHLYAAKNALSLLCAAGSLAAAGALVYVAFCRWQGKETGAVPTGIVTVFCLLQLVCNYRSWMSQPQLHRYIFHLLHLVCLALSCYHQTALESGERGLRRYFRCSLAMILLGCLAIPGNDQWLSIACFVLYGLGNLLAWPRHDGEAGAP